MIFHHVQLLTTNLTEQLEFYRDILELPVLEQSTKSATFQVGFSKLEFVQSSRDVFYHFAFNTPSHQFAEAKEWLSKRVDLIQDSTGKDAFHTDKWNADNIYFYDAGGNIGEFIARHDLKSNVSDSFSARSLECVSELGVVTDNVPQTVQAIQAKLPVHLYRATMDDMFVPVGDETGLLIVVKRDRIWFPETKAAKPAPFTVTFTKTNAQPLTLDSALLGLAS
jgi:catechol 2,3-dioxygenase-like lactoylglutathione lyase family enzyme